MNRTLTYPPQMAGFKPYGAGTAHVQDGAGTIFHAALGSLGDDKATFHVWVWSEAPNGALALIAIPDPPTNAPSFHIASGRLVLSGVRGLEIVERDVPGFAVPVAWDPRVTGLVTGMKAFLGIK